MAAESADDVVVFPIPISPVPIILVLLSFSSLTVLIPVRSALSVISSGIAFSFIKLFVPCISLWLITPSEYISVSKLSIPISKTIISEPAAFDSTAILEVPSAILFATAKVTSLSDCDMPSLTIPLSAHITVIHLFEISGISLSYIAESFWKIFSNSPRLSRGFAILSQCFFASCL